MDTETATTGTENAIMDAGIATLALMNASTSTATPTFDEQSDAVKCPPWNIISGLVAVRGEGLAVDVGRLAPSQRWGVFICSLAAIVPKLDVSHTSNDREGVMANGNEVVTRSLLS